MIQSSFAESGTVQFLLCILLSLALQRGHLLYDPVQETTDLVNARPGGLRRTRTQLAATVASRRDLSVVNFLDSSEFSVEQFVGNLKE